MNDRPEPTLTVFMSNYNHGKYIARALEAIVSQSRPPDEFLLLDDGSTDDSVNIIMKHLRRHSFITFMRNEKRTGFSAAMDLLLSRAAGDYVYGAAADDYILPGFFEKSMTLARRYPDAGIIFGKMVALDSEDRELYVCEASHWQEPLYADPGRYLREYLEKMPPHHSQCGATVYRRRPLEEVGGFRKDLGAWGDTFAADTIALQYGACYLPERLSVWRVLPGSVSMSGRLDLKESLGVLRRAAALMRSADFRGRYPERYVRRWERRYRNRILGGYLRLKIRGLAASWK